MTQNLNDQITEIAEVLNDTDVEVGLKEKEIEAIKQGMENAPEDYPSAVRRIMELEMRLEDLSRACEIAEITRQLELVESFRRSADDTLSTKMVFKRENTGDINLTVITGQLDPAIVQNAKV